MTKKSGSRENEMLVKAIVAGGMYMEYRETAIQLVLIIAILTGILIKLLASIVIGLYRDLTAGYRENELTFLHKLFYAVLSVGGLAILFMAGVAIISGGLLLTVLEFAGALIIGILLFK